MHCGQQCQEYCKKWLEADALFSDMLNSDELFDQAHQHLLLFGYKIQQFQVFHVAQFHCTNFPFFGTQEHIVTECLRVNKLELISRFPFVVNALSKCLRLDMPVPTDVNLTLRRCYELVGQVFFTTVPPKFVAFLPHPLPKYGKSL